MANEINISVNLNAAKSGLSLSRNWSATLTMAGEDAITATQFIQATNGDWEALVLGEIAALGQILIKNLDTVNDVEVSPANDGTDTFAKMSPGGVLLLPAGTSAFWVRGRTPADGYGTARILLTACEA